jgi:hypothetical protein
MRLEFLAVTGRVELAGHATIEIGQFQAVHQLHDTIISGLRAFRGEEPINRVLQLSFVDGVRDLRHLSGPNLAAQANAAGQQGARRRLGAMVALLPMLEFVKKPTKAVDRRQHFEQRDVMPGREKGL